MASNKVWEKLVVALSTGSCDGARGDAAAVGLADHKTLLEETFRATKSIHRVPPLVPMSLGHPRDGDPSAPWGCP